MISIQNRLKKVIKDSLKRRGYELERIPEVIRIHPKSADLSFSIAELLIDRELARSDGGNVVQIGAFDGKSNDFTFDYIRKYGSNALLVEPQDEAFNELVKNYKNQDNLILEKVAIAEYDGVLPFYRIKEEYHASFRLGPQLASSDRKHLENALSIEHLEGLPANRDECIECVEVPCLRFDSLLEKHNIEQISVLQIDTEGFDYEIIKMIDFNKIQPEIINFEIVHLSKETLDEAMLLLFEKGYEMLRYGINMIAKKRVKTSVDTHFFH